MTGAAIKVLLIEDNPGDAHLIGTLLDEARERQPCELTHVDRLGDGIKRLWEEPFDLVLLDLSLPDSHGLDTIARAHKELPAVPVLVLTGLNDEAVALEAVQIGAQDYLVKGEINQQGLVRAMRYAIERHRLLHSLSLTDELTGLYNRRGFFKLAEQHVNLAQRMKKEFLLVYVDLDGLKQINDTFGHHVGSEAIAQTGEILRRTFRTSDIVARLGGDEFVIVAANVAENGSEAIAARLQAALDEHNTQSVSPYRLSLSVGVARFDPESPALLEDLLAQADEAMYEQKRRRKMDQPALKNSR